MQESIHNSMGSGEESIVTSVDATANDTPENNPLLKVKVEVMTEVVANAVNEAAGHSKAGRSTEARQCLRMVRKVLREFDELIVESMDKEENGA